jgi:hypothetical protein
MKNDLTEEDSIDYTAKCESLKDLLKAVSKLPDTIERLQVQRSLQHFQPPSTTLNYSDNLVEEVEAIIKEALREESMFGKVDTYYLSSYYGKGKAHHPYYISLCSEKSRKFGERMANGEFGPLD